MSLETTVVLYMDTVIYRTLGGLIASKIKVRFFSKLTKYVSILVFLVLLLTIQNTFITASFFFFFLSIL